MAIKKLNPDNLVAPTVGGVVERTIDHDNQSEEQTVEGDKQTGDEELADEEKTEKENANNESREIEDVEEKSFDNIKPEHAKKP
jgi:hypothetical protein